MSENQKTNGAGYLKLKGHVVAMNDTKSGGKMVQISTGQFVKDVFFDSGNVGRVPGLFQAVEVDLQENNGFCSAVF